MYFRVGYTFIGNNSQLRSSALIVEAKDAKDALKQAETKLKEIQPAFKIGQIQPWLT